MVRGKFRGDLDTDRQLNLALVRLVEVIGEAAARVPEDFRRRYPQVPWRQTVGLRNRLIHGYDVMDFDILWAVLKHDLPELIEALEAIVNEGR
jgi:uncharacterized protein with HEPN domain